MFGKSEEAVKKLHYQDIPEWDSLKFLMIIADLEDELGVVVPIEKADEIETVEDILSFIEE